ncbi:MAG: hypothetical protein GY903_01430 [Fuerstiella sp.]|nr:hypothetical protein [Fuerstiella sp.]MCP4853139.1 hypothetical protein [Fuerstiella sp.]
MFNPHKNTFRLGLATLAVLLLNGTAAAQEVRKWTDDTGGFSVDAKFVSEKDGTVTVKTADGEQLEIPVAKLSKADQDYVKGLAANPFRKKSTNPFQPSMKTPAAPKSVSFDWSRVEALGMPLADTEWTFQPDASQFTTTPKKITLPGKTDFFEKATGFVGNSVAGCVAAGYRVGRPGNRDPKAAVRLVLADVNTGRVTGSAELESTTLVPLAIHDDGQQIIVRNDEELEIWTLSGKKLEKTTAFDPYPDSKDKIVWSRFLNDGQFATWNGNGKLAVWQFDSLTPIYKINTGNAGSPDLSGNRKYIVFVTGSEIGILDTEKKEITASISTPGKLNWPTVKFSPSGDKLACAAHMTLLTWDLTTGELQRKTQSPYGVIMNGRITFPHDNFLLLGGSTLIELNNQLNIWKYSGMGTTVAMGEYTAILINQNPEGAVLIGEVPHPPVFDALEKALNQPDLFVFRKGVDVRLDVSGIPANKRSDVQKILTDKLNGMNCSINPAAKTSLVARITGPKSATRSYRSSGDHKVTVYTTALEVIYDGDVAWHKKAARISPSY